MTIDIKTTLRECRRKKNVTQEELAAHLAISGQAVSNFYLPLLYISASAWMNCWVWDVFGLRKR